MHTPSHVPEDFIGEEHVCYGHQRQRDAKHKLPCIELEGKGRQERESRGKNRADDNAKARDAVQLLRHNLKACVDETVRKAENEGKAGEHEERPVMQESGKRRARGFGGCRGTRRSSRDSILLFVLIRQTHGVRRSALTRPETNAWAHEAHHQGKHSGHDVAHEKRHAAEQKGDCIVEQSRANTQGSRLRTPLAQEQSLRQSREEARHQRSRLDKPGRQGEMRNQQQTRAYSRQTAQHRRQAHARHEACLVCTGTACQHKDYAHSKRAHNDVDTPASVRQLNGIAAKRERTSPVDEPGPQIHGCKARNDTGVT